MSNHPVFAAVYDRVSRAADRAGLADRRRHLLSRARGRVLDVGSGTGLNVAHYREVDEVVLLEPDQAMRARLNARLSAAAVPVTVDPRALEEPTVAPDTFDTVVCTFVLCTVPDLTRALARVRELLRADGQLLFLEHVRTPGMTGKFQRAVTPLWQRMAAGCQLDRDTPSAIREAGFVITDCERFRVPGYPFTGRLVQGRARRRNEGEHQ